MLLLNIIGVQSLTLDALAKNPVKIQFILPQELQAFDLADHDIVIAEGKCARTYIKVIDWRFIFTIFVGVGAEA